jgi:diketogulonate reductase-like aldo/keto reductase
MDYRELGRTGVKVSSLCLGTMTFGEQNSEAEGHAQMDYALDRGINMFDAAEIYPVPPKPETQGRTEAIIGTWLGARKVRDKVMIATKIAGRGKMTWVRKNEAAATRHMGAHFADVLEIPEAEVKAAKASVIAPNRGVLPLVQFVRKYSQCLNWIMCGCPRSMIRQLAGRPQDVPVEPGDLPYEPTPTLH